LDYKLREELREELPKIFAASGAVLVYATTEPSEALQLGGATAALDRGRVTQFGPTVEVYRRPVDRITAEGFSHPPMNFVTAEIARGVAHLPGDVALPCRGPLSNLADGKVTLGFRPNHLHLRRLEGDSVVAHATVSVVEITGSESFIHVRHAGQ